MIEKISQTIIQLIHSLLILYIILVPWINRPQQLFVVQILLTIVFRWITNQDACFLTYLESAVSNKNVDEGFIYRIVSPVFKVHESKFNKLLYFLAITWATILLISYVDTLPENFTQISLIKLLQL